MKLGAYRTQSVLLVVILLIAAFLRFRHVDQPFVDAISWRQSDMATIADNYYQGNWNILLPEISWNGAEANYVGYEFQTITYLTALLYRVFGQHDWVGRSVAIGFGIWGIFALYQLVLRVWDRNRALLSAAVMAVMPGSIFIERSFLPDPVMVALVTTSAWLLVAYLQTNRQRFLIWTVVAGIFGFLTKISGLIVGIPMLYAIFAVLGQQHLAKTKTIKRICIAACLTLLPVIAYYLWAHYVAFAYPPYHVAAKNNWLWNDGLQAWLKQDYFLPWMLQKSVGWLWGMPVVILAGLGLLTVASQLTSSLKWLFHWWLLSGIIFYIVGAKELVHNPWNFHVINPAMAALSAQGIAFLTYRANYIGRSIARQVVIFGLLSLIFFIGRGQLQLVYFPYAHQSYQLGLAMQQVSQPDDLVVTVANAIGEPTAIYYSKRRGWIFPPAQPNIAWASQTIEDDAEAIQWFEDLRAKGANWFGIVDDQRKKLQQNNPQLLQHIEQYCTLYRENSDWVIYRILS